MGNHLMVDELVPLGQHDVAVQSHESAEFIGIINVNFLVLGFLGKNMFLDSDRQFYIIGPIFSKPSHLLTSLSECSFRKKFPPFPG